jgi:hypothetical protein
VDCRYSQSYDKADTNEIELYTSGHVVKHFTGKQPTDAIVLFLNKDKKEIAAANLAELNIKHEDMDNDRDMAKIKIQKDSTMNFQSRSSVRRVSTTDEFF